MSTNVNGFAIFGAIEGKWLARGGLNGPLRLPLSNEIPTFDGVGRYQNFNGGIVSWHPQTGANIVWGAIGNRWLAIGREKFGYPITDELTTPDRRGRYNHFRSVQLPHKPEVSIYWTPTTGAHEVYGAIRTKWAAMGWERSPLGYPLTGESPAPDGRGRYNHFEGGSIYWTPATGAHEVHGAIRAKWSAMGWERSLLGYPLTDETTAPDGRGRYNHFEGGSIYWTPATGAHEVHGAIRAKWSEMGWERSFLGYPTSDEMDAPNGGRVSHFEHGSITWSPATGAVPVPRVIKHHAAITTPDWLPVGGWVDYVVNDRGDFTFTGHLRNSGAPDIDVALAVTLMTPSGVAYAYGRQRELDGTLTFFGRDRDDDWTETGNNAHIAGNWDQVTRSQLHWRMEASDTLSGGIQGLVEELVEEAAVQLGRAGAAAVIALI